MSDKRLGYIDLIKGFGILIVVLGHAMIPRSPWIYSFHVPLFFFISGFMYKDIPLVLNITAKLKKIYFPFVIFNVITWLFFYLISLMKHIAVDNSYYANLYRTVIGFDISVPQNGPLWFLLCLFSVSVIYIFISLLKSEYLRFAFVVAFSAFGYFISQKYSDLPFKIETAMMMIPYFYLGNLSKKYNFADKLNKRSLVFIFNGTLILGWVHFILNTYNLQISGIERISVLENRYGNIFLFYSASLCAILYISTLAEKIDSVRIINYFGKNSLIILCVHYPILQYVERIHPVFLTDSLFFDLISSLITIILCVPFILILKRGLSILF